MMYYCPACGNVYEPPSFKYIAFCPQCCMPTPVKASAEQVEEWTIRREDSERKHHTFDLIPVAAGN